MPRDEAHPRTLAELTRMVEALDPETRARAANALADLVEATGTHIERLHATLGERSPWVRYYLWKLRELGGRAGVPVTLHHASEQSVEGVVEVAQELLDRVAAAVDVLERALEDDDARVRAAALKALGGLAPGLVSSLRRRGDDEPGDGGVPPADGGPRGNGPSAPGARARSREESGSWSAP